MIEEVRKVVDKMVMIGYFFFIFVFFVSIGIESDVRILIMVGIFVFVYVLFVVVSKVVGCGFGVFFVKFKFIEVI